MSNSAKLRFNSFDVTKVVYDRQPDFRNGHFNIDIQHIPELHKDDQNKFQCVFIITIGMENTPFTFQVQAVGGFEIIEGEADKNLRDNYINISAPSIVYPYIRAFISNLVMQSGMSPIVIPPMNFALQRKIGEQNQVIEQKKAL